MSDLDFELQRKCFLRYGQRLGLCFFVTTLHPITSLICQTARDSFFFTRRKRRKRRMGFGF